MILRLTYLALMLSVSTAACADLGRLFFTPAQRTTLDNARQQNLRVEIGNDNAQAAAPVPESISVNGIVKRSDGKSTIWVNNQAVSGPQTGRISVSAGKTDNHVRLSVPESGRVVDLKVGQTVEIVSGGITDSYSRRPPTKEATPENTAPAGEQAAPASANARTIRDAVDSARGSPGERSRVDSKSK